MLPCIEPAEDNWSFGFPERPWLVRELPPVRFFTGAPAARLGAGSIGRVPAIANQGTGHAFPGPSAGCSRRCGAGSDPGRRLVGSPTRWREPSEPKYLHSFTGPATPLITRCRQRTATTCPRRRAGEALSPTSSRP